MGAGALPDAELAVRRFIRYWLEVLNGFRPAAHLRLLARPAEALQVVSQGIEAAGRVSELRKRAQPPGRRPRRRPPPVALTYLRVCEPRPGAVEAAAALVTSDRTWALALRMEFHNQSWSATTLRLI